MRRRLASVGLLATILLAAPSRAHAADQKGVALDQLDPAPAGDTFVGVPSPFARGSLTPRGLLTFDYALDPLRLQKAAGTSSVVNGQGFLHVNASFAVQDRLLISVLMPFALVQGGDNPTVGGTPVTSPSGTQIGDLRAGLRVRMFGDDDDPFQIGVGAYLFVPTGASDSYVSEGSIRATPHLSMGGRFKLGVPFVWTAYGGAMVRGSDNPSKIAYGAGLAFTYFDDKLQVGPEFFGSTPIQEGSLALADGVKLDQKISTNAELLVSARVRVLGGLYASIAGGPGFGQAVGTPSARFVGSVGWAPGAKSTAAPAPVDPDGDGLTAEADACPYAFGPKSADPKKSGCPVIDDDEDGIPNAEDACPAAYGRANSDAKQNGCPPAAPKDSDADGIPDIDDACPQVPGQPSFDKTKHGCNTPPPDPDIDADGIPDTDDACPREKGAKSSDPKASGCPKLVRVNDAEIVLLAPVELKPGKKVSVSPDSEALLNEVRDVLAQHPEITKVEVQAHTDNTGKPIFNTKVSQAQAEAVMAWLTDHGVPAGKLTAHGYGPERPIADNATKEGRAKNKRIQLVVVEKKPR
ncbi:MAG: OmpA family protein [Byssovorax sp.]